MTEALEEILEYLIDTDKYIEDYGYQYKRLSLHDTFQLLDYITNLQQDLEKAIDTIEKDRQFYKCRMDEYIDLKKENEELKQTLHNITINGVEEENMSVLDLIKENEKLLKKSYKDDVIITKAIEYIEENYPTSTINYQDDKYKLINILNGVDKQ